MVLAATSCNRSHKSFEDQKTQPARLGRWSRIKALRDSYLKVAEHSVATIALLLLFSEDWKCPNLSIRSVQHINTSALLPEGQESL